MTAELLHIFRNTPFGKEALLQSAHFCKELGAALVVYIPPRTKFLMYFGQDVVQIELNPTYLSSPQTARSHVTELLAGSTMAFRFLEPKQFAASALPEVPSDFDFFCCPRSISDLSSKIRLGYIGPKVRRIVRSARFPILIPSLVFKPWECVAVFFGGSANAVNALKVGIRISRTAQKPLHVYTYLEENDPDSLQQMLEAENLDTDLGGPIEAWHFFDQGTLGENLYAVPHDALIVAGAFGHGLIRNIVFGNKLEKIQSVMPNNLLIVGPQCGELG